MDVLGYISAALGGGLFTALVFVVGYTNKISTMSTKLDALSESLKAHISSPPTCSFHQTISDLGLTTRGEVEHIKGRLTQLENAK